mgnify:CR=1 FL=1
MKILVVAATQLELGYLGNMPFSENLKVITEVLGVGQMATTYRLLDSIGHHKPDLAIQIGIAGCFSNNISLGEVMSIETEYMGDVGAEENGSFQSIFDLNLVNENEKPFTSKGLVNPHKALLDRIQLKKVVGITVNEISTSSHRIHQYKTMYNPMLETMEGAAFHYCCLMKNLPFIQIRAVSNYVGERNKSNWKIDAALQAVATSTKAFISNL